MLSIPRAPLRPFSMFAFSHSTPLDFSVVIYSWGVMAVVRFLSLWVFISHNYESLNMSPNSQIYKLERKNLIHVESWSTLGPISNGGGIKSVIYSTYVECLGCDSHSVKCTVLNDMNMNKVMPLSLRYFCSGGGFEGTAQPGRSKGTHA